MIDQKYLEAASGAKSGVDLFELLQGAIQLEHATIPPYMTAAYSLKNGINSRIKNLILDIAEEEMLHMTIVGNLLNAIGGKPMIDDPGFIPKYPSTLPMNIGNGLKVGLRKFSKQLVKEVFMEIEEPETRIIIPSDNFRGIDKAMDFPTIGVFYRTIIEKIKELGEGIFTGDPSRQVIINPGFPPEQNFPITNVETAVKSLNWIIDEGEGTSTSPFEKEAEPAHFYRFEEIVKGRQLVKDPSSPVNYSYRGRELIFDSNEVWNLPDDPKESDYEEGSAEFEAVHAFNIAYSNILRLLQKGFDGDPQKVGEAVQLMGSLRGIINNVVSRTDPNTGKQCGLTFEFVPLS